MKKEFLREETNVSKIELNDIHEVVEPVHSKSDLIEKSNLESVEVPLRRSDKVPHQLDRYYIFLIQNSDTIELDENDEHLITYMEAMQRHNSQK